MKKALLIIFVLALVMPNLLSAQETDTKKERNFGIHSIGIGAGAYNPFLTFLNESSYTKGWTDKFKTGPIFAANLEVDVYKNVRIRVEGSYWSQTAKNSSVSADLGGGAQELALTLTPVTGTLLFNILPSDKVQAYVGIGGGACFISSKYKKTGSDGITGFDADQSVNGKGATLNLVQGLDIPLVGGLRLGLEARFVFGDFNQDFYKNSGKTTITKNVSLQGMQGLATLNYAFGK